MASNAIDISSLDGSGGGALGLSNDCSGDLRSDKTCIDLYNDPGACCMSMTLRNVPLDPSNLEIAVMNTIILAGTPIYENDEGHVCMSTGSRAEIAGVIDLRNKWYLLPEGDSVMYYTLFCDKAIQSLTVGLATVASAFYFAGAL